MNAELSNGMSSRHQYGMIATRLNFATEEYSPFPKALESVAILEILCTTFTRLVTPDGQMVKATDPTVQVLGGKQLLYRLVLEPLADALAETLSDEMNEGLKAVLKHGSAEIQGRLQGLLNSH